MILKTIMNLRESNDSQVVSLLEGALRRDYVNVEHGFSQKSFETFKTSVTYFGTIKSVKSSDFYQALYNYGTTSPLVNVQGTPFPVSIRYMSDKCIVFERPPFKTSVRINMKRSRLSQHKEASSLGDIWIPWTVWVVHFNGQDPFLNPDIKLYFNDKPIETLNDILSPAFTPNLYIDNRICWGQTIQLWQAYKAEKNNKISIAEFFSYFINDYFSGGWNLDLHNGHLLKVYNNNISMFRQNPVNDSVLMQRAIKNKVKLKDTKTIRTEGSQLKNVFLNWSLLTLDEIINTVSLYKEKFILPFNQAGDTYTLSSIINLENDNNRWNVNSLTSFEDEIVENLFKRAYTNTQILTNVFRWKIIINTGSSFNSFWSEIFAKYDVKRKVFNESINSPDQYYFENMLTSYLQSYFTLNKLSFVDLMKKQIDDIFLQSYSRHSSTESELVPDINLSINIEDISTDFENCFALWILDPNNRFLFTEKQTSNLVETA